MSIVHLLENFGTSTAGQPSQVSDAELETAKLDSFETGYKAGWDDAMKSVSEEDNRISGEFARNLSDLSFTYHEAHSQVLRSIEPLLSDIIDKVLPEAMRATIGVQVADQLKEMARESGKHRVEIVTSTGDLSTVEGLLTQDFGFPIDVTSDETLAEGQVFLRMAEDERQIDINAVIEGLRQAVDTLIHENERSLKHG